MPRWSGVLAVLLAAAGCTQTGTGKGAKSGKPVELLNVSYDPTRELWQDLNAQFTAQYERERGTVLSIKQSHGGSGSQARSVIDGLEADVVTLALWSDTDAIRKAGLIDEGWEERLPNRSLPYISTIVFVVRKGNPKGIHDWPDLVRPGIEVITPNPKTSGNGKLSFLAAWGSVSLRAGSEADAEEFVRQLYRQTPVLDSGARAATTTFAQKGIGDVHLTWENEAHLEVKESGGRLELIYPPVSIRAEPHVAVVSANARRRGTEAAATAYLEYLYGREAQETIARHKYRPTDKAVLSKHAKAFPAIELFSIEEVAGSWDKANERFFSEGGVFDSMFQGN